MATSRRVKIMRLCFHLIDNLFLIRLILGSRQVTFDVCRPRGGGSA